MRAIQITEFGGPEVLRLTEVPDPEPHDGLVVMKVSTAGVNYADTHQVEDSYLSRQTLPLVPGGEAVGRLPDGRRVVALLGGGGYAERALVSPELAFDVPDQVEDAAALALVLQGTTAWHLLRTTTRLQAGETVVVHAAAGGVGSLAVQLARRWSAGRIIATASSPEKRDLALSLGADIALDPETEDLQGALREANSGRAVDVVLEMTGGRVFDQSLAALAPFGRLATFGMASRQPPAPVDAGALMRRSQTVAGFWLVHCLARPGMLAEAMADLLGLACSGDLRTVHGGAYPLSQARQAHEDLRARRTTGKLTLDPTR